MKEGNKHNPTGAPTLPGVLSDSLVPWERKGVINDQVCLENLGSQLPQHGGLFGLRQMISTWGDVHCKTAHKTRPRTGFLQGFWATKK